MGITISSKLDPSTLTKLNYNTICRICNINSHLKQYLFGLNRERQSALLQYREPETLKSAQKRDKKCFGIP